MKIALITPRNSASEDKNYYDMKFVNDFIWSKKYLSYLLAIPVLISLTPEEHEVKVFDENIEQIDYQWPADLVGISVRTVFAKRAYEIADVYRSRGVKTVLGGIHPTMCTDEALQHADGVVIGEAEHIWPQLLEDVENGRLKKTYTSSEKADLKAFAMPRRDKLTRGMYFSDIVQTSKGCPFDCEFCSVHAFDGQRIRNKSVEQVVAEILDIHESSAGFKKKSIFFADDNIIANKAFARDLFKTLKPYGLNWSCQASINIAQDDALLKLMKSAGCGAILIGFESVSKKNLAKMGKTINLKNDYLAAINKIQSNGITVHAAFIMGYDFDTPESFDELIEFIKNARLLMPLINILTPFPGTKLYQRFEAEGRILHRDWSRYDGKSVVFKPALMSPEKLDSEFRRVIQHCYSFETIFRNLNYFWDMDFWRHSNRIDPIRLNYRVLFALRLISLLLSNNKKRSEFILKILPRVFEKRVRISTILTLMAYNNYAFDY